MVYLHLYLPATQVRTLDRLLARIEVFWYFGILVFWTTYPPLTQQLDKVNLPFINSLNVVGTLESHIKLAA